MTWRRHRKKEQQEADARQAQEEGESIARSIEQKRRKADQSEKDLEVQARELAIARFHVELIKRGLHPKSGK